MKEEPKYEIFDRTELPEALEFELKELLTRRELIYDRIKQAVLSRPERTQEEHDEMIGRLVIASKKVTECIEQIRRDIIRLRSV